MATDQGDVVRTLEEMRLELWDAAAASLEADGVQHRSLEDIRGGLDGMADTLLDSSMSLSHLASTVDVQLPLILTRLDGMADSMEQLLFVSRNPTATAADELRRRGLHALRNGWFDEAAADLRRSIETFPYDSMAHFMLGWALASAKADNYHAARAASAFAKASKYGAADYPSLSVTAVIMAARLYDKAGRMKDSVDVLREMLQKVRQAPEVAYALACRTGDVEDLVAALSLDPSLIVDARGAQPQNAERAARRVLDETPGFARLQHEARENVKAIDQHLSRVHNGVRVPLRLPEVGSAGARLALFASQRRQSFECLQEATHWLEADMTRMQTDAQAAFRAQQSRLPAPPPTLRTAPTLNRKKSEEFKKYSIGFLMFSVALAIYLPYASSMDAEGTSGGNGLRVLLAAGLFVLVGGLGLGALRSVGGFLSEKRANSKLRAG